MTGSVILLAALCGQPPAQPAWLNAFEVKIRPAGQKVFTGAGLVAVEFFRDPLAGAILAVTDKGQLAAFPGDAVAPTKAAPGWLFAHDLKTRAPNEAQFSPTTKAFGVEAFKDTVTGKLVFVSQVGGVAVTDYPTTVLADKSAKYHHALTLPVRTAAEDRFSDKTKRVGVEVYLDGNSGRLVYITDAGFLAVATAPPELKSGDMDRKPVSLYGRAMRVRKASEPSYSDSTAKMGVEVYKDAATGYLVYVTEAGGIAVAPAPADVKAGQGFREERGLLLSARPPGDTKYENATRVGVEVVTDNNTGHTLYLADTGTIAVLPKK